MNKPKITAGELKGLKPGDRFLDRGGAEFQVIKKPRDFCGDLFIDANPVYGSGVLQSIITGPFYINDIKRILPKQRNQDRKKHAIAFKNSYRNSLYLLQKAAREFVKTLSAVFKDLIDGANAPAAKFEPGTKVLPDPSLAPGYINSGEPIIKPWLRRDHYRHVLEYINSAPDADREIWSTSIKERIRRPYGSFQLDITADPPIQIFENDFYKCFPVYKAPIDKIIAAYDPDYLYELYQRKND